MDIDDDMLRKHALLFVGNRVYSFAEVNANSPWIYHYAAQDETSAPEASFGLYGKYCIGRYPASRVQFKLLLAGYKLSLLRTESL